MSNENGSLQRYKQLATASWLAPVVAIVMGRFLSGTEMGDATGNLVRSQIHSLLAFLLYLLGCTSGLCALFRVKRHERTGILVPAAIGTVISGLLLAVLVAGAWTMISRAQTQEVELEMVAERINRDLPREIDEETTLQRVSGTGQEMTFEYSLVNYSRDEIDSEVFARAIRPQLVGEVCELFRNLGRSDVSVRARHSSSDGVLISETVVAGSDCEESERES